MGPALDARLRPLLDAFLLQDRDHAVVVIDPEGRIVGWLAGAERVLGFHAADAIGQPLSLLFLPQDRERRQPEYELEVARAIGRSEDDRWHLRADRSPIWVTGTLTALHDDAGRLLGFVKVMRDRTDLRTQTETLENRIEGLLQKAANTRLVLDTVGHEMRNPLGPLKAAVRLIERQGGGPGLTASLQIVARQIALLERLADDLLDLTRLETGRLQLHSSEFDLQALLHDCVAGFEAEALAKGITLQAMLPDVPIRLFADPQRLQQVVLNLIGNALKFTGRGGFVVVRAVHEGRDVLIQVEDDGAGIAPELLPRIFELFSQGGDAPIGGLGIGLALARDIVELHGGNLEARSPGVGKGAEFSVRLPLRPRPRPAPPR